MDIELSLLRGIEKEKAIPFDELVSIIEQAILTAYAKHTSPDGELPEGTRARLSRSRAWSPTIAWTRSRSGRAPSTAAICW